MITMLSKTFQNVYYNLWYTVYYNVQISLWQLTKLHRLLKNEKPGKISAQKEKLESSELKFLLNSKMQNLWYIFFYKLLVN